MQTYQSVFERREIKYMLSAQQYAALRTALEPWMEPDAYGNTAIHSLYYDTPDWRLIRASLEKPVYKEKLRLRTYGDADPDSPAFVELKKKYRGIVYKRRTAMPLRDAYAWLSGERQPEKKDQIHREIDWFLRIYPLHPAVLLSYDRIALVGKEDPGLRVTFDSSLRWKDRDLRLEGRGPGTLLLPRTSVLMEVKVSGALPLWLCRIFGELGIVPTSYSKYGAYYQEYRLEKNGVIYCA